MKKWGIVGIQGVDTRALTSHLRNHGAQMGIISTTNDDPVSLLEKVRAHPGISVLDLVSGVTAAAAYTWEEGCWKWCTQEVRSLKAEGGRAEAGRNSDAAPDTSRPTPHSSLSVVVYDFGVKFNILRNLAEAGFGVRVVPARTPAEAVLEMEPEGIVLSNGPGDPEAAGYAIEAARKLLGKKPIFGICLGHQILGLAMGGRTYKLKFGHHGGNHPVKDLATGKVEITSQNHNYCVDVESLRGRAELTHRNLYDGTEEGMRHVELPVFSVQHHPEAGPGPNDSAHLFRKFRHLIETGEV